MENNMTIEQIEKRFAEIKNEVENADEARVEELTKEVEQLEARRAQLEVETRKADILEIVKGAGKVVEKHEEAPATKEVRSSQEYINAYAEYIKTGDDRECRALLTETVSGTVPVPVIVDEIIRTAWDKDDILSRVRKTNIRGNLKVAFEKSADGAYVHTEGTTAPTEESLELGIVTMIPRNIKKWITISDEALAMGGEAFLRYVYDELTYQIIKKLSALVVADIKALSTSASSTAPAAAKITKAPGVTTVAEAACNLSDEASDLVVIMNRLTKAKFLEAQAAGNFNVDPFDGLPVLFSSELPAYDSASTNAVYAIVGDLKGEQVNYPEGEGIVVKYDDLSLSEKDLVKIVGRQYAAHAATASGRFCNIAKPSSGT